jgi:ribosome biogenesis protein ENP2
MNVQKRNDVTIYNLSSGPQLPEWLGERARRNLAKRDEGIRRRIELIQDFQMPSSSSRVIQYADGRYIMVEPILPESDATIFMI